MLQMGDDGNGDRASMRPGPPWARVRVGQAESQARSDLPGQHLPLTRSPDEPAFSCWFETVHHHNNKKEKSTCSGEGLSRENRLCFFTKHLQLSV